MPESLLIVEDCAPIATVLAGHLTAAGFRTTIAPDGERALEIVADERPDCILLDLMLPGISGTEVLDRLRADAATATIPVVLVSAQVGSTQLRAELDVDAAVGKPFTRVQLVDAVRNALAKRRQSAAS
jgi:CheY-like chemotaxis protein